MKKFNLLPWLIWAFLIAAMSTIYCLYNNLINIVAYPAAITGSLAAWIYRLWVKADKEAMEAGQKGFLEVDPISGAKTLIDVKVRQKSEVEVLLEETVGISSLVQSLLGDIQKSQDIELIKRRANQIDDLLGRWTDDVKLRLEEARKSHV